MTTLKNIFEGFKNINVLVIGDVMVDAYIWGNVKRISPEAPVPIINTTGKEFRLGGAANVALNLHALGAKAILCAIVGADHEGDRFIERLRVRKIEGKGIVKSKYRPTTMKTRILSGYQHIVRIDSEIDAPLSKEEENDLLAQVFEHMNEADIIVFEDYDKGTITENIIKKVIQRAREKNIPTVVDPKRRNFHNYAGATIFKPNLKELVQGLKLEEKPKKIPDIIKAVNQLKDLIEVDEIYLTLAEKGVIAKSNDDEIHVPAHLRTISDVSGAGDTVIGIISLCKALGLSMNFCAHLSNIGGGLVCEHVGVVPVNRAQLFEEASKYDLAKYL